MKKKSIIISVLVIFILLVLPYLFRDQLYIDIANRHINKFSSDWDTVFVKFTGSEVKIKETDLSIKPKLPYSVRIFKGTSHHNNNYKNATIIIDVSQYSWVSISQIEDFAREGTTDYEEYYLFGLFKWFLVSYKLTGMA